MDKNEPIYLDYAATTPVDERVIARMQPYFTRLFGNPSSIHRFGQAAEAALDEARETIATCLNCHPEEILFTSCGTESDNLALRGATLAGRQQRNANHILISNVEHPAVSATAKQLANIYGFELEMILADKHGRIDPEEVRRLIRPNTAIVSVIYANNEIGTVNPIADIGLICREHHVPFHTDAVQAVPHLKIDLQKLNVDLLSLGAHKFYGPKGVGALYIRKGTPLIPAQTGGSQEFSHRAGTHNIPYIIGLAEALRLIEAERDQNKARLLPMRDFIIGSVLETIPESMLTGHPELRLPNHASFVFKNIDGNRLLMFLDIAGYACSSGSACKTGDPKPSEILISLGLSDEWALGSLRVTLGKTTSSSEVNAFLRELPEIISPMRGMR